MTWLGVGVGVGVEGGVRVWVEGRGRVWVPVRVIGFRLGTRLGWALELVLGLRCSNG